MWPSELKINILLGLWEPCVAVLGLGKSRQHTASIVRFLGPSWMCHFSYFSVVIVWESGIWDFYNFGGFLGFCIFSIFLLSKWDCQIFRRMKKNSLGLEIFFNPRPQLLFVLAVDRWFSGHWGYTAACAVDLGWKWPTPHRRGWASDCCRGPARLSVHQHWRRGGDSGVGWRYVSLCTANLRSDFVLTDVVCRRDVAKDLER